MEEYIITHHKFLIKLSKTKKQRILNKKKIHNWNKKMKKIMMKVTMILKTKKKMDLCMIQMSSKKIVKNMKKIKNMLNKITIKSHL